MAPHAERLKALRGELAKRGLAGFIIPLTDEHMSEYVGAYAQRLAWLTGFTGSAGNAAVLMDKAAVFIDGRYVIQIVQEVDDNLFERLHFEKMPMFKWLKAGAKRGDKIGYDPELATVTWEETARAELAPAGIELVALDGNPIDAVWTDQPEAPLAPAVPYDVKYAGRSAAEKRADIAAALADKGADAAVVTMLDSVAWAFNIRGEDVRNTPVTHAFAIVNRDESATLFINGAKVTNELRTHLGNKVQIEPREAFYTTLKGLGEKGATVLVDRASNNAKVFTDLKASGAKLVEGADPCILLKACKNTVEQQGMRDAHVRDGAAIAEFLCWLEAEAPKGTVDELSAAAKLWEIRKKRDLLQDRSFDTISGAGPNGALCHYRVSEATNRKLKMGELYLVDSGGQYLDGTTDITRTMPVGAPTDEMKDRFTRVLKGHIALATVRFPTGTSGQSLDAFARRPLWEAGLDYDHGTGHGVGSYLAVHEGPQRIAKASSPVALSEGMVLSNEPGYYKEGAYGIRIENLVLVRPSGGSEERDMLEFETITFAPINRDLVDVSLLTDEELGWLNAYHAETFEKIGGLVDAHTKGWLAQATAPLAR